LLAEGFCVLLADGLYFGFQELVYLLWRAACERLWVYYRVDVYVLEGLVGFETLD
jgi:hypothetical protein